MQCPAGLNGELGQEPKQWLPCPSPCRWRRRVRPPTSSWGAAPPSQSRCQGISLGGFLWSIYLGFFFGQRTPHKGCEGATLRGFWRALPGLSVGSRCAAAGALTFSRELFLSPCAAGKARSWQWEAHSLPFPGPPGGQEQPERGAVPGERAGGTGGGGGEAAAQVGGGEGQSGAGAFLCSCIFLREGGFGGRGSEGDSKGDSRGNSAANGSTGLGSVALVGARLQAQQGACLVQYSSEPRWPAATACALACYSAQYTTLL